MKSSLVRVVAFLALMAAMAPDDAFCKGGGGGGGGRGGGGFGGGGASRGFSGSSGGVKSGGGVKTSGFGGSGGSNRSNGWSAPKSAPSAPKIGGSGASNQWAAGPKKSASVPAAKVAGKSGTAADAVATAPAKSAGPNFSVERDTAAKKPSASASVDEAMREKAATTGSGSKSREERIKDLKASEAKSYQATFAKEPATRPDYIPQSTNVGGTSVQVTYNSQYGGYGYMHGGSWRMYDTFADILMWDMLLNRHNQPVVVASPGYAVAYPSDGGTGAGFALGMILFVVIIGACVCVVAFRA